MAERAHRRRLAAAAVVALCTLVLAVAIWVDVQARTRTRTEVATLAGADSQLITLQRDVIAAAQANGAQTTRRDELTLSMAMTLEQLAGTNAELSTSKQNAYLQGVSISTLQTCFGGIHNALTAIKSGDNTAAARDVDAVSGPCTQLAGGTSTGLVYPFDFPDPDVILSGTTYYAYATNSVAGNIQIIESTDLAHWTALGNALPKLPSWASADFTWAPSVALIGGTYHLYYAVDPTGSTDECISVATAGQPQGPFSDTSSAPLECQNALGGSIDPSVFVAADGTPYLQWKSGGPGSSMIWSQQLAPSGTAFAPASSPTVLLTPDQPWEAGTVEAPDLVEAGGHYDLFFSGNDWNSADYAVGVATCSGPLGPCADASPTPILAAGNGVSGPGGESVFADTSGSFWIAFDAWVPGAVGSPNSRGLYLRRIDLSRSVPAVGGPVASSGTAAG